MEGPDGGRPLATGKFARVGEEPNRRLLLRPIVVVDENSRSVEEPNLEVLQRLLCL
jgi:hypothetical protein